MSLSLGIGLGLTHQRMSDLFAAYTAAGFAPAIVFDYSATTGSHGTGLYKKAGAQVAHDDLLLHTATGGGTVTDSDGVLKHRAHNLLSYSDDILAWNSVALSTGAAGTTPYGVSVPLVIPTAVSGTHYSSHIVTTPEYGKYRILAKAGGYNWFALAISNSGTRVWFDLTNGVVGLVGSSIISSSITLVSDGWYLCELVINASSNTSARIYIGDADNSVSFTGDGSSGIYFSQAQLNRSDLGGMQDNPDNQTTGLEQYVPTTTAAVYKRRNNYTFSGTYETDGTELVTNGTFDTDISGWTDPTDGRSTASFVSGTLRVTNDVGSYGYAYQAISTVIGQTYTFSADGSGTVPWRIVGGTVETNSVLGATTAAAGTRTDTITFVATSTTSYISVSTFLTSIGPTIFADFDNVSVQERIPVMVGPKCLVEPAAATNLFTYPDLSSGWTVRNTDSVTTTLNASVGRDGNSSMTKIEITDTTNEAHGIDFVATLSVNTDYAFAFDVKDIDQNYIQLWMYGASNHWASVVVDLTTGSVTDSQTGATSGIITFSDVEDMGNGIYRISMAAQVASVAATEQLGIHPVSSATPTLDTNGLESYVGVAGVGFYANFVQLEASSVPSSYIPTSGATATRALETLVIPAANLASVVNTTAMSISLKGLMSYADLGTEDVRHYFWQTDASNVIKATVYTASGRTGEPRFQQSVGGVLDLVDGANSYYSPDVNVPFNIASRHTSGALNGAVNGSDLVENTTPTSLVDLSATDLEVASKSTHNIQQGSLWGVDIGDAGIGEAST